MPKPVVTRFAPSPTGFLHIGSTRTALFNWLYARAKGGKMLLRIEDTDRKRSSEAATDAIYEGLKWLGLDWDGQSVSQYSQAARHREIAHQLLSSGNAYRCYTSGTELEEMRKKARASSQPMHYEWRERDATEAPAGRNSVIRLKSPQSGQTIVTDAVQGDVKFANSDLMTWFCCALMVRPPICWRWLSMITTCKSPTSFAAMIT